MLRQIDAEVSRVRSKRVCFLVAHFTCSRDASGQPPLSGYVATLQTTRAVVTS
jgi:hypothetical protein